MPSSISSSELRHTPEGNWPLRFLLAVVLTVVVVGAWELRVRSEGYGAVLDDTSDLWAERRAMLEHDPEAVVIIGASRALFDLDLPPIAEHFDREVLQLALVGSRPLGVLENVAAVESFRGTLIVGVVPPLWFVPAGFPLENTQKAIDRYEHQSPAQRAGFLLGVPLQNTFAFLNNEDLALRPFLEQRTHVPDREGAMLPPKLPPYFAWVDRERQARMWDECDFGTPLAEHIQRIWIPLFTPPPPPPGVTPEQFREGYMASMEDILARTAAAVKSIQGRGGRVVFVRCPSTGQVREIERNTAPREGFWDRILAESGAPGVHFEDHESLRDFDCPEWSHLTAEDAVKFTAALLPLLDEALAGS